jgi:glucan phosphoethanolaminetransferase (alkaline phosphatase superfamily)
MMTKSEKHDIKEIWGAQAVEQNLVTVERIRADADKFRSAVRRRNRVEYTAAVFVVAVFVAYIWIFPTPLMRLGSLLIIAAAILIMVWIHFRASANTIPSHISFMDYISRYREELRRQQTAARTVWLWYLAPWVPGIAVFTMGIDRFLKHALGNRAPLWPIALVIVVMVGVFAGVWLLNLWGARRLQRQIDELNRLLAS